MIKDEEKEGKDGVIQAQEVEERPQRERKGGGLEGPRASSNLWSGKYRLL